MLARCRRALRLFLRTPSSERLPQLFHLDARQSAFGEAAKKHARAFSVYFQRRRSPTRRCTIGCDGQDWDSAVSFHLCFEKGTDGRHQATSPAAACCSLRAAQPPFLAPRLCPACVQGRVACLCFGLLGQLPCFCLRHAVRNAEDGSKSNLIADRLPPAPYAHNDANDAGPCSGRV